MESHKELSINDIADGYGIETPQTSAVPSKNADEIPAPETSKSDSGALLFVWAMGNGERIAAKIEWPSLQGRELWGMLSVFYRANAQQETPSPLLTRTRWNLRSTSHTDSQIRVLNRRGSFQWDARLEQIKAHVEGTFQVGDTLEWLGDDSVIKPVTYMLHPFLEEGQHTVLSAYGGSTKSLFGLASAISIADGVPILPGVEIPADMKGKTLYLDYEADRETHDRRYRQLLAGNEVTNISNNIAYLKLNTPLLDAADAIVGMIRKHGFKYVVIDSASRAVGGETIDESSVISYFNMVSAFKTTTLTIAHKPKDERSRGPSGSSHWYHQARSVWELLKDQTHGDNQVSIAMKHEKSNNGMLERTIGYQISFSDVAINYSKQDAAASAIIAERLPPIDRIYAYLRENPASQAKDIAVDTGMKTAQANQLLKRGEGDKFYGSPEARGRRWSLVSKDGEITPINNEVDEWWNRD